LLLKKKNYLIPNKSGYNIRRSFLAYIDYVTNNNWPSVLGPLVLK